MLEEFNPYQKIANCYFLMIGKYIVRYRMEARLTPRPIIDKVKKNITRCGFSQSSLKKFVLYITNAAIETQPKKSNELDDLHRA